MSEMILRADAIVGIHPDFLRENEYFWGTDAFSRNAHRRGVYAEWLVGKPYVNVQMAMPLEDLATEVVRVHEATKEAKQ